MKFLYFTVASQLPRSYKLIYIRPCLVVALKLSAIAIVGTSYIELVTQLGQT